MMSVLNEDILDSPHHYTYIVIDDLDRDWTDEKIANDLIRCLFRAVVDLKRVENLKVLVALRTNIFEALDFGRSGGQEEKFRSLIHRVLWNKDDLRDLLDNRVRIGAAKHSISDLQSIADLLPRSNKTMGDPFNYILSRTLMRPRDAISFLNECLSASSGKEKVTWRGIRGAEVTYSNNRLLALRDEWKPTFPGIESVLRVFTRAPVTLTWTQMTSRLDDCALLTADKAFSGTLWMTALSEPIWAGSGSDDPAEVYQPLVRLLHNIGFIGCVRSTPEPNRRSAIMFDEPAIYNYDDPAFPDNVSNLRQVTGFVVHPAFRPALDIADSGWAEGVI